MYQALDKEADVAGGIGKRRQMHQDGDKEADTPGIGQRRRMLQAADKEVDVPGLA